MALLDRLFGKRKSLGDLSPQELRREEILLQKDRDRLLKNVEKIGEEKKKLFERGAAEKSPEVRKMLAADFELKTQEQLQLARELNLRTKEIMTVCRLRMVRERQARSRTGGRLNITVSDLARVTQLIEDDAVRVDAYADRLDEILRVGAEADREAVAASEVGQAGAEVLKMWEELDRGTIKPEEALQEADRAVRRRAAPEQER